MVNCWNSLPGPNVLADHHASGGVIGELTVERKTNRPEETHRSIHHSHRQIQKDVLGDVLSFWKLLARFFHPCHRTREGGNRSLEDTG